jgi:hypothetical protein
MKPEELLDLADQMLTARVRGIGSLWPRVCALLIRLALERSLDRYWARVLPEGAEVGMRQQLLLLPQYTRSSSEAADAASLAREAWLGRGAPPCVRASADGSGTAPLAHGGEPADRRAR